MGTGSLGGPEHVLDGTGDEPGGGSGLMLGPAEEVVGALDAGGLSVRAPHATTTTATMHAAANLIELEPAMA